MAHTLRGLDGAAFAEIPCVTRPGSVEAVNEAGYLNANPDVRRVNMSARDHFAQCGQREGRLQFVNEAEVGRERERKLARLRFRGPASPRAEGAPTDHLTPSMREAFRIPDAPPVSSNEYGGHLVDLIRANPDKLFLDVGAGLRHVYFSNVVNTEIYPSLSTDVVCLGEDLPFESDQFDYVLSFAVLEHTRRPWDVAREMCRVLKPGGQLWVDYPFLQPVHGYPHHYFNATPMGSASLFEPWCDIQTLEIFDNNHPIRALTWILELWRNGLSETDAASFEAMRVADLLVSSADAQMALPFCRDLDSTVRRTIAAGSSLIAVKRLGAVGPSPSAAREMELVRENAGLHEAIETIRASTSWRVTAPLRALGRLIMRTGGGFVRQGRDAA